MFDGGEAIRKLALNVARYSGLAPLARPFVGGIGAILMLHRVTATPEKPLGINRHLNIAPAFLDAVIADMKAGGYAFVSLDEAIERIRAGGAGGRFATITADDAYRDNLHEALPVLEKHAAPLTVYVAPAMIDGEADLWWDVIDDIVSAGERLAMELPTGTVEMDCSTPQQKYAAHRRLHDYLTLEVAEEDQRRVLRALARASGVDPATPSRTLMNWDEIRQMAAHPLVTIGAHTINHYNLKRLTEAAARRETTGVLDVLQRAARREAEASGLSLRLRQRGRLPRSRSGRGSGLRLGRHHTARRIARRASQSSPRPAAHFGQRPLPERGPYPHHAVRYHHAAGQPRPHAGDRLGRLLLLRTGRQDQPLDDAHGR